MTGQCKVVYLLWPTTDTVSYRKRTLKPHIQHTLPNIHLIAAALQNPTQVRCPSTQISPSHRKLKLLSLARFQELLLKSTQLPHGPVGNPNIKLRDFRTACVSGVGDVMRDVEHDVPQREDASFGDEVFFFGGGSRRFDVVVCFCSLYGEVGVVECCVAEAEAEFVLGCDVVGDEVFVVDVYAFGEIVCRSG